MTDFGVATEKPSRPDEQETLLAAKTPDDRAGNPLGVDSFATTQDGSQTLKFNNGVEWVFQHGVGNKEAGGVKIEDVDILIKQPGGEYSGVKYKDLQPADLEVLAGLNSFTLRDLKLPEEVMAKLGRKPEGPEGLEH